MILHVPVNKGLVFGHAQALLEGYHEERAHHPQGAGAGSSEPCGAGVAQEYESKINSGDPVSIAEVVRDLHVRVGEPEQSYSERQLYEAALERLSRELAAVEGVKQDQAETKIEKTLRVA